MIQVQNLTKYYGDYLAVENVTFDVPQGQIVGFLGPNGAGKSTTMRILTGYLTPTSGKATIAGFDVFWKPIEARRRIGYLPENCPLYSEMRVIEYLKFRAGIKGVRGSRRKQRLNYVLERCWLTDVRRQIIGTLSKGFRQRVGLADSLLADPPVLILDEPTAGLDPQQIRSTRQLIRELGQQHTILLSTHILSEVEMTCDHVIIIHKGRVARSSSIAALADQAGERTTLIVELEGDAEPEQLQSLPGLETVSPEPIDGGMRLRISATNVEDQAPMICQMAVERGWRVREIRPEKQTLEDMFVSITGET